MASTAIPHSALHQQAAEGVKPVLLRSSLKKASSLEAREAIPETQLLYCKANTDRVKAQEALVRLLTTNRAQVLETTKQDKELQTAQGKVIVLECTEEPFPWDAALGNNCDWLKVVSCRKGFLAEEAFEGVCALLAHRVSNLVVVCGSATSQHLLDCVNDWKSSEQRWRRTPRQYQRPKRIVHPELSPRFARQATQAKPAGIGKWFSCIGGGEATYRPNTSLYGQVTPMTARDPYSDTSDSDDSDEELDSEELDSEDREDAYVPAIEAVSAQQYQGHRRRVAMQIEDWEEKPRQDGKPALRRQVSADAYCCSRMQSSKRKEELQATEATLAQVVETHAVLVSQLLLRKLSKRLDPKILKEVEVAPLSYNPETQLLRVIKRSWWHNSCYYHEEGEPKTSPAGSPSSFT